MIHKKIHQFKEYTASLKGGSSSDGGGVSADVSVSPSLQSSESKNVSNAGAQKKKM